MKFCTYINIHKVIFSITKSSPSHQQKGCINTSYILSLLLEKINVNIVPDGELDGGHDALADACLEVALGGGEEAGKVDVMLVVPTAGVVVDNSEPSRSV